jgi:hypothetical protein
MMPDVLGGVDRLADGADGYSPSMTLSPEDRRALEDLERQLAADPGVDDALREMGPPKRTGGVATGLLLAVVGAAVMIGFLPVFVPVSFVGFVVLFAGVVLLSRRGTLARAVRGVRTFLAGATRDGGV